MQQARRNNISCVCQLHLEEVVSQKRNTKKNSTSQKIKKERNVRARAYLYSLGFSSLFYFSTFGTLSHVDLLLTWLSSRCYRDIYVPRNNITICMNNILYTRNFTLVFKKRFINIINIFHFSPWRKFICICNPTVENIMFAKICQLKFLC